MMIEYKVVEVEMSSELEDVLNELTKQGWELVGTPISRDRFMMSCDSDDLIPLTSLVAIFKREVS